MITLQHSCLSLNFISSPYCYCCFCSVGIGRLMIFTASAQPKAHASTSSLLLFTVCFHAHNKHPNQQHNARWPTAEGLNGRSLALIYVNTALLLLAASVMPLMMNSHKAHPTAENRKKQAPADPKHDSRNSLELTPNTKISIYLITFIFPRSSCFRGCPEPLHFNIYFL